MFYCLIASFVFIVYVNSVHAAPAPYLVISEIQISGPSGFSTDEFIELYNPTDLVVDLSGWQLIKRTASGTTYPLIDQFDGSSIPAHGFFLIAHPTGYRGSIMPDVRYTTSNSLASDNSVELVSPQGIVDLVGWGKATYVETATIAAPGSAKSIERKALSTSTKETMAEDGTDMFRGNGEDTDNNSVDFLLRDLPQPQNAMSELEFVTASAPTPTPTLTNTAAKPMATSETVIAAPVLHTLVISELFPDPKGQDLPGEYIEINNIGPTELEIAGWKLSDASRASFTLPSGKIAPGAWRVFWRKESGIALNNTNGETLTLTAPDGFITSTVAYTGTAPEEQAYALIDGKWVWTGKSTPGAGNVFIDTNQPPKAVISDFEPKVWVNETIKFSAAESSDPEGDDLEYAWQFSDGGKANGSRIQHIFKRAGKNTITLLVSDAKGKSTKTQEIITIQDYQRSSEIFISALLPNPGEGEDEWIELQNQGKAPVNLAGWILQVGKKKIKLTQTIDAKSTLRLIRDDVSFALSNAGTTVTLLNPDAKVQSSATYVDAQPSAIFQRQDDGKFIWGSDNKSVSNTTAVNTNTAGKVAGATTTKETTIQELPMPKSNDQLPIWAWLVIAGGLGLVVLGYELYRRWKT